MAKIFKVVGALVTIVLLVAMIVVVWLIFLNFIQSRTPNQYIANLDGVALPQYVSVLGGNHYDCINSWVYMEGYGRIVDESGAFVKCKNMVEYKKFEWF